MAVRMRVTGEIVCAAMYPEMPGDVYIDDGLHYQLSVEKGILVSEPMARHRFSGLWWWWNAVPVGVAPDPIYAKRRAELATMESVTGA